MSTHALELARTCVDYAAVHDGERGGTNDEQLLLAQAVLELESRATRKLAQAEAERDDAKQAVEFYKDQNNQLWEQHTELEAERDALKAENARLREILQDAQVLIGEDATELLRKIRDNAGRTTGPVPTPKLEAARERVIKEATIAREAL